METPFRSLSDHGLATSHTGKVREILDLGGHLILVTSDRISAFDCVLPSLVPGKGKLLNRISTHWFRALTPIVPTHFVSDSDTDFPPDLGSIRSAVRDRWMLVRKARRIPVECVVRGHLAGSGLQEYQDRGTVGGIPVTPGIPAYGKLPEPLFTPTTKEDFGHDRALSFAELQETVGGELAARLRDLSIRVFSVAERFAASCGLTLVDTKFEFGWIDGELCLIDEALTPDSSRYWDARSSDSGHPISLDKEYVREYLKGLSWDRNPPAPPLPEDRIVETYRRYRLVHDRLGVGGAVPDLRKIQNAS
jgi:phosphoribosylaminoimidazole-succinocarboxamide synthase